MAFAEKDKEYALRHFKDLINKGSPPHTVVGVMREYVRRVEHLIHEGLVTEGDGTNKRLEMYRDCALEYIRELETLHNLKPAKVTHH